MQIVETTNEGLKRAYTLKIPAKEIEARIDAEVKKVAPQVRMPGFRPGKVPANLIRKMHGAALHSDALNASLRESVDTLMREKQLRPALQPKVDLGGRDGQLVGALQALVQRLDSLHDKAFVLENGWRRPWREALGRSLVRAKGLEPPHLAMAGPKPAASTSSATPAGAPPVGGLYSSQGCGGKREATQRQARRWTG